MCGCGTHGYDIICIVITCVIESHSANNVALHWSLTQLLLAGNWKLARITSQSIGHVADVQFVQQRHVYCARNQMGSRNYFYISIHSIQPGVPSPINLIFAEEIRSVLDIIIFVFLLVFVRRRERWAIEQWIAKEIGRPCCFWEVSTFNVNPCSITSFPNSISSRQYLKVISGEI